MKLHHDPVGANVTDETGVQLFDCFGMEPALINRIIKRFNEFRRTKRHLDDAMKRLRAKDAEIFGMREDISMARMSLAGVVAERDALKIALAAK